MEARTVDPTGGDQPAPSARRGRRGGVGWLGSGRGRGDARGDALLIEELEAEVTLLREENARLKVAHERDGGSSWGDRMATLVPGSGSELKNAADDVWELMTECQVLRSQLVDACRDVESAMKQMRRRLDALALAEGVPAAVAEPRQKAEL